MSAHSYYFRVIEALEEIDAPYMTVGAFAGLAFGVHRATFDVDILVDLRALLRLGDDRRAQLRDAPRVLFQRPSLPRRRHCRSTGRSRTRIRARG